MPAASRSSPSYDGRQSLKILERGRVRHVQLPYTSIKPYLSANGSQVALIASSPVQTPSVVLADMDQRHQPDNCRCRAVR